MESGWTLRDERVISKEKNTQIVCNRIGTYRILFFDVHPRAARPPALTGGIV
jgi:hypothetical protein